MGNFGEKKNGMVSSLFGTLTESQASGLSFSGAAFLPYVFSFIFLLVGALCGLFYDGYETDDWYLYVSYLLSQMAFATVAVWYFATSKKPVKMLIGKPKAFDFALAIALQFGLMFFLGSINEWFMILLESWGLSAPEPKIPSLDGFGYVGVLFVIALLPAVFEEVFFRGVLLNGLKGQSVWVSALICGGLFSLFHQNPAQTLYQFVCGVAFALIALRSGSILPTVVAHFLNNAFIISAEKFAWQAQMLPVLIVSAVCFFLSGGYLVYSTVKREKQKRVEADGAMPNVESVKRENRKDRVQFLLFALAGVLVCVMGWISRMAS